MNADVVRKSLDAVDRGRIWMRVLAVAILLGALFFALAMTSLSESAGERSLRLEVVSGSIAVILCVFGMGIAILRTSNANARRILKAIELLSESGRMPV
ncbi:MAG: hypothetical protein ABSH46_04505 [Bryobacteraceae bacterium]|jgi:uncharacterized membrane protein